MAIYIQFINPMWPLHLPVRSTSEAQSCCEASWGSASCSRILWHRKRSSQASNRLSCGHHLSRGRPQKKEVIQIKVLALRWRCWQQLGQLLLQITATSIRGQPDTEHQQVKGSSFRDHPGLNNTGCEIDREMSEDIFSSASLSYRHKYQQQTSPETSRQKILILKKKMFTITINAFMNVTLCLSHVENKAHAIIEKNEGTANLNNDLEPRGSQKANPCRRTASTEKAQLVRLRCLSVEHENIRYTTCTYLPWLPETRD